METVVGEDQADGAADGLALPRLDVRFRLVAGSDTIDVRQLNEGVRVGLEDLYRAVNERIQELTAPSGDLAGAGTPNEYVCECGNPNCRTNVRLTWEEFAEISAEPDQYLVAARHLERDIEVIRRAGDYAVVRLLFGTRHPISRSSRDASRTDF